MLNLGKLAHSVGGYKVWVWVWVSLAHSVGGYKVWVWVWVWVWVSLAHSVLSGKTVSDALKSIENTQVQGVSKLT